jgi:glycosyltransferase A (GT-A) superfamily protein (DUF2064 family)
MTSFAAVIPVIDERDAIGDVVRGLRDGGACCVFVVDGGSTDGSPAIATDAGAIVIAEPRRGYGRACLTGAAWAIDPDHHVHEAPHESVAFLDGDGSCDPASIQVLVDALAASDVALGRRPGRLIEPGAMPWHARLGNRLIALILSIRTGRRVHDLPPAKAIRTAALRRLQLDDPGYGWTVQLVGRALADPGLAIDEVAVPFRRRRGGVSKVSGSVRASMRAAQAMFVVALRATRPRPLLAMMAKAPGPGNAKTRLSVDLGDDQTAGFWRACLGDTSANLHAAAMAVGLDPVAMVADPSDRVPVKAIIGPGWGSCVQRGRGLSGALIDVFLEAFDRGTDRAMAVAGDVPTLAPAYIIDAFGHLDDRHDAAVVGPSADGGYNLVALRWQGTPRWWPRAVRRARRARLDRRLRAAFDVPMGGASAREATTRGLTRGRWVTIELAMWPDVDTVLDLRELARSLRENRHDAPRTAAWLAEHRALIEAPADQGAA